jgi:hypothetical protein
MQLFDTRESLAVSVAAFLAEGFANQAWAIVVATPSHWASIEAELEALEVPTRRLETSGRLTVMDPEDLLRRFLRRGEPVRSLFAGTVGAAVRRLSRASGGRLRIYGEMVELLAEEGNYPAAIQLEELWNELAAQTSFSLLCGYSAAHFAGPDAGSALADICRCHTHATAHGIDPLGEFLLARR